MSGIVIPEEPNDLPHANRARWIGQIDVKADNILIYEKNNAWQTDFGAGYPGIDKDIAEAVARDFASMPEQRGFVFPST